MLNKIYARQSPNITLSDLKALWKVLRVGQVSYGPMVEEFEKQFAAYVGVRSACMVNMGRTAEFVALKGLNFKSGDEIIMPSYNFPIVPIVVKMLGLKPVFVDVEEDTFNINPLHIEAAVTPKTKAILITHMCGHPCEMDKIMAIKEKYGLLLIEDAVHSLGAEYKNKKIGTFGDVSYFSFYSGKTLTTFMGAAVCTDRPDIALSIQGIVDGYRRLSNKTLLKETSYGLLTYLLTKPYIFSFSVFPALLCLNFFNSRFLDEKMEEPLLVPKDLAKDYLTKITNFQSAIGLSQLKKLDVSIFKRIENARTLSENIIDHHSIIKPAVRERAKHTFLYYFIRNKEREAFRKKLIFKGIDTKRDSNRACSHLAIFQDERKYCPVSEQVAAENTLIPNYPLLSKQDMLRIAKAINCCVKK